MRLQNNNLLVFFVLCLLAPGAALSQQHPHYIIRLVQTDEKPEGPAMERIAQTVLKEIDNSKRIDVLPATSTDGAATHLGEAVVSYNVGKSDLTLKSFSDSLSKITFSFAYDVSGGLNLMLTEVETGRIANYQSILSTGKSGSSFELTYKELAWDKTKDKADEKLKAALVQKARGILSDKFSNIYNDALNNLIGNLRPQTRLSLNNLFPYRLKVLQATEVDKDEAEKVQIEGGKTYDLIKGDRMVVYTVREVKSNGRSYERFEVLGRLKYELDNEKGGICDVSKGKEEILAALQAGQTVWCRIGGTPYTLRTATEDVRIAVGSFITPKNTSPKVRELLYRRVRAQILSRKGFAPLEREKIAALQSEKDLQKREEFMDQAAVEQFKSVGADLILEVKIQEPLIEYAREFMTNKVQSVSAVIGYTLRLLDVATGEVLNERAGRTTKNFSGFNGVPDPLIVRYAQNPESVSFYQESLAATYFDIALILNETFPPRILVSEVTDVKKDRAEDVLLIGDFNIKSHDKYYVMRKRKVMVDGQELTRFEQIGLLALRDSEGEGIVNAKVKDGGKEILAAMKAGEELFCLDKPNLLDKMAKWGDNRMERYGY